MTDNTKTKPLDLLLQARIESKIYLICGKKVILDRDLAELYRIETRTLNQAVRRNQKRFPEDFMFQLNRTELKNLISQNVTSSWGGVRKLPLAFTEQGVAMLSRVLNSERAIEINIRIVRTFIKLREILLTNKELREKIEVMDKDIAKIFFLINWLLEEKKSKKPIGFLDK